MKTNIDVLFIHPRNYKESQRYLKLPSIEITEMAGILKDSNYTYQLLDCNIDNIEPEDSISLILEYHPKVTLLYGCEFNHINLLKTVELLKSHEPTLLIGANGMIVTFIDARILMHSKLDFVIKHNGPFVLKQILELDCDINSFFNIKNLSYKVNHKFISNDVVFNDLNLQPQADRNVYNLAKYKEKQPEAIVRSSWGCPSKCFFCNKSAYSKFRLFSMEWFFEQIDCLLAFGYKSFFFADDTFAFSLKRLDDFCDYYKKGGYNFRWTSNLRVSDITQELIYKMKQCGAYRVFIGIETVSAFSNTLMNKTQNVINLEEKIAILKSNNIEFHASFIVGNPGDSINDLDSTIKFIKENPPTLATFNTLKLFPGTVIFDSPEKFGIRFKDKYWFENPSWLYEQLICTEQLSYGDIDMYSKKMMLSMFEEQ